VMSLVWPQNEWHAYLVAAGLSAGNVFFNPTVQAVIPAITSEDQRLAANSVAFSTGRLVQIVAAATAGGLIAMVGTDAAFVVNGATFLVSALLIVRLRIPAHGGQLAPESMRQLRGYLGDARNGLRFAARDRFISRLLIVQALASLATGATSALLVVLSQRHLRLEPAGFAWLIGAIGLGALLGPLVPNMLNADYRDTRWLFLPYVIRGIGDITIALLTPLPIALLILFIYGLNTSAGMVIFNSTLQTVVPDAVRGRVFTLLDVTWNSARLLSLAAGALLVDAAGIRPVFWIGGSLLICAGLFGLAVIDKPLVLEVRS